jgi:hypothetical protein
VWNFTANWRGLRVTTDNKNITSFRRGERTLIALLIKSYGKHMQSVGFYEIGKLTQLLRAIKGNWKLISAKIIAMRIRFVWKIYIQIVQLMKCSENWRKICSPVMRDNIERFWKGDVISSQNVKHLLTSQKFKEISFKLKCFQFSQNDFVYFLMGSFTCYRTESSHEGWSCQLSLKII